METDEPTRRRVSRDRSSHGLPVCENRSHNCGCYLTTHGMHEAYHLTLKANVCTLSVASKVYRTNYYSAKIFIPNGASSK